MYDNSTLILNIICNIQIRIVRCTAGRQRCTYVRWQRHRQDDTQDNRSRNSEPSVGLSYVGWSWIDIRPQPTRIITCSTPTSKVGSSLISHRHSPEQAHRHVHFRTWTRHDQSHSLHSWIFYVKSTLHVVHNVRFVLNEAFVVICKNL